MADPAPVNVLVIDDEADARANLCDILDRKLPDSTAEQLLPRLKLLAPQAAVLIVSSTSAGPTTTRGGSGRWLPCWRR